MSAPPFPHGGHDYAALRAGWERLAAREGWRCETICEVGAQSGGDSAEAGDGFPVLMITAGRQGPPRPDDLYLSAGVHGDECAPPWALLAWAEASPPVLRSRQALIFPCLNPVGFVANTRFDSCGLDLNRAFHDASHPLVAAWHRALGARRFDCAVLLHEDYAASGIYLYELRHEQGTTESGMHEPSVDAADAADVAIPGGAALLAACAELIPRERAVEIDGNEFDNGHFLRSREIEGVVAENLAGGWPEALWLFLRHSDRCFTFETPSELDLERRVATQRRFLERTFASFP